MQRLGITLPPAGGSVREAGDLARRAESLGYTDAWTAEVSGTDAFSVCTAIGLATSEMRVGVAIVPVFSRPPALLAMSASAAQDACGGRFCLGLGASTPTIVEGWMGTSFDRPLTRMRETMSVLRTAFAGEKVKMQGDSVTVNGFKLESPPARPVPVFVAGLGPRMMKLAADEAEGLVLFATTRGGARIARAAIGDKELLARLVVLPNTERDEAAAFGRWLLTPYIAAPGYNEWIARQGFEEDARGVRDAWSSGDRDGARAAISDALVEELVLYGDPARIKERVAAFREAGLDTPVLMVLSQEPVEDLLPLFV